MAMQIKITWDTLYIFSELKVNEQFKKLTVVSAAEEASQLELSLLVRMNTCVDNLGAIFQFLINLNIYLNDSNFSLLVYAQEKCKPIFMQRLVL